MFASPAAAHRHARPRSRCRDGRLLARTALVLVAVWTHCPARADTANVPASHDTTLYANDGTLSNGAGQYLFAGVNNNNAERRALIAFDVAAAVPAGSTITAASLVLDMSRTAAGDTVVSVHRVTSAWGEAGSHASGEEGGGAIAQAGDATWTYRSYATQSWTTAGGDFDSAVHASATVGAAGTYSFIDAKLAADAQQWLDTPSGNLGWLLLGEGGGTAKRFGSRDNLTAAQRPTLVLTFSPPGTTGACCSADGGCSVVLEASASSACAGSGYLGASTSCSPNPCPQPTGACCIADTAGTCQQLSSAACATQSGTFQGVSSTCAGASCPAVLPPFADALPLPKVATPTRGTAGSTAQYTLAIREFTSKLHRDLPATTVWGFDDGTGATYPGPTLEASTGEPISVTWQNDLRELATGALRTSHYLPVDTCTHGATVGPPKVVVHLHGGHVPARFDGYPSDAYPPGEDRVFEYPNAQQAATLFYHDHSLGVTRLDVYMGLVGLYVLRDAAEGGLGLPSGSHEIPLVIQDRSLRGDGTLIYPAMFHDHVFGNSILVNGKVWPYLNVDRGKYRFRVLNACNGRTLRLSLSNGTSFAVIGSDGGLLRAPVTVSSITLGAAERAEIVIDFQAYASGTEIVLQNDAPAPFPGTAGVGVVPNVLKFVVGSALGHTAGLPASLVAVTPIAESASVKSRDFVLQADSSTTCAEHAFLINGMHWDEITEYPQLGTVEIWRFVNASGESHPMHVHLVQFQILDRQPVDVQGSTITPTGSAAAPAAVEAGWKDTVTVQPREAVRVIARFTDYTGNFAYHCHTVEHEDHEMMRQFVAVTTCGDGVLGQPDEACDDGGESATCNADCTLSTCGDGKRNASAGEACDGGGESTNCDADCTAVECGDGVVNRKAGELCDDGAGPHEASACRAGCSAVADAGSGGSDASVRDANVGDGGAARDAGVETGVAGPGAARADAGNSDGGPHAHQPQASKSGGCGCRTARGGDRGLAASLLCLSLATLVVRRRARVGSRGW